MLIIGNDNNLDDALTTLPVIEYLIKTAGEKVFYKLKRPEILSLVDFVGYQMEDLDYAPSGLTFNKTYVLNTPEIEYLKGRYHPTVAHYVHLDLPISSGPINPKTKDIDPVCENNIDIVIAPFGNDADKIPKEKILEIIQALREKLPEYTIGMIMPSYISAYFNNATDFTPLRHLTMNEELSYMLNARCVLTVNNEYSRLAQLYSNKLPKNHALLCSLTAPEAWYKYPNLNNYLCGNPQDWPTKEIVNLVACTIGGVIC